MQYLISAKLWDVVLQVYWECITMSNFLGEHTQDEFLTIFWEYIEQSAN